MINKETYRTRKNIRNFSCICISGEKTMVVQSAPVRTISINTGYRRAKRTLDLAFTLLIAPFLILVGVAIALCIKLDSEGPIFYRQKRIGVDGGEFEMLKFRSMYVNNDE